MSAPPLVDSRKPEVRSAVPTIGPAEIAGHIRAARRVLFASHINPDADTLGSALAVAAAVRAAGAEHGKVGASRAAVPTAVAFNDGPVPYNLRFLPGADTVVSIIPPEGVDLTVTFDNGSRERFGTSFTDALAQGRLGTVIVVDHHTTPVDFGDFHFIRPTAAATGELAVEIAQHLLADPPGPPASISSLGAAVAINAYAALATDTGFFRYSNTTAGVLRLAADLIDAGANPWDVVRELEERQPVARLRILGRTLESLEISADGRHAALTVRQADLISCGATAEHLENIVNFARALDGVEVATLLREDAPGVWKASLRSKGAVDVAELALRYKGGGHRAASGCTLRMDGEAARRVLFEGVAEAIARTFPA